MYFLLFTLIVHLTLSVDAKYFKAWIKQNHLTLKSRVSSSDLINLNEGEVNKFLGSTLV